MKLSNTDIPFLTSDPYKNPYKITEQISKPDDKSNKLEYKYSENDFLDNVKQHVDQTYSKHYGGVIQPVEFIMSNADTLDYLKGNVIKYIYRYGKKNGANSEDLYKAVHFIMMMAHYKDKK